MPKTHPPTTRETKINFLGQTRPVASSTIRFGLKYSKTRLAITKDRPEPVTTHQMLCGSVIFLKIEDTGTSELVGSIDQFRTGRCCICCGRLWDACGTDASRGCETEGGSKSIVRFLCLCVCFFFMVVLFR